MDLTYFAGVFALFSLLTAVEGGFFDLYCYRCHSNEKGCGEKLNWWLLQREVSLLQVDICNCILLRSPQGYSLNVSQTVRVLCPSESSKWNNDAILSSDVLLPCATCTLEKMQLFFPNSIHNALHLTRSVTWIVQNA